MYTINEIKILKAEQLSEKQEAQLSQRDRATCYVRRNLPTAAQLFETIAIGE